MADPTTQPPAETLAINHARECLRTIGETKHVQIKRVALETLLAALTRRAGGNAIPAGEACTCQCFPTHQADDCPAHGLEAPFDGVPHDTPKPPAGGDAGAVERLRGVEGIGAGFNRDTDCWHFYTMPGMIPLAVTIGPGFDRGLADWVVEALRAALALPARVVELGRESTKSLAPSGLTSFLLGGTICSLLAVLVQAR